MSTFANMSCSRKLCDKASEYMALSRIIRPMPSRGIRFSAIPSPSITRSFTVSLNRHNESVAPQTHYEMFPRTVPHGPPPHGPFVIDIRQLRKEFLTLQAKAHPDRHHGADKARAEGASARINEAYKTLQSPLLRARYLLGLRGINLEDDESTNVDDPELLMEVLDTREDIEAAEDEQELLLLRERNDARIGASERALDAAFKADDLQAARDEAIKMKYWMNIKESLEAWQKGRPVVLVH